MYDLDHIIDILVRLGLLLRESLAALRPSNDAACFQFLIDAPAGRVLDGGGAAHGAARAVAGGAKGFLHAARLTDQHPTRASHIAGDDDRLADFAIDERHFGMSRRKRSRRPLAMHPHLFALAVDDMFLELGDIMADIVDEIHLQFLPRATED